jgi:hypothetical protein
MKDREGPNIIFQKIVTDKKTGEQERKVFSVDQIDSYVNILFKTSTGGKLEIGRNLEVDYMPISKQENFNQDLANIKYLTDVATPEVLEYYKNIGDMEESRDLKKISYESATTATVDFLKKYEESIQPNLPMQQEFKNYWDTFYVLKAANGDVSAPDVSFESITVKDDDMHLITKSMASVSPLMSHTYKAGAVNPFVSIKVPKDYIKMFDIDDPYRSSEEFTKALNNISNMIDDNGYDTGERLTKIYLVKEKSVDGLRRGRKIDEEFPDTDNYLGNTFNNRSESIGIVRLNFEDMEFKARVNQNFSDYITLNIGGVEKIKIDQSLLYLTDPYNNDCLVSKVNLNARGLITNDSGLKKKQTLGMEFGTNLYLFDAIKSMIKKETVKRDWESIVKYINNNKEVIYKLADLKDPDPVIGKLISHLGFSKITHKNEARSVNKSVRLFFMTGMQYVFYAIGNYYETFRKRRDTEIKGVNVSNSQTLDDINGFLKSDKFAMSYSDNFYLIEDDYYASCDVSSMEANHELSNIFITWIELIKNIVDDEDFWATIVLAYINFFLYGYKKGLISAKVNKSYKVAGLILPILGSGAPGTYTINNTLTNYLLEIALEKDIQFISNGRVSNAFIDFMQEQGIVVKEESVINRARIKEAKNQDIFKIDWLGNDGVIINTNEGNVVVPVLNQERCIRALYFGKDADVLDLDKNPIAAIYTTLSTTSEVISRALTIGTPEESIVSRLSVTRERKILL